MTNPPKHLFIPDNLKFCTDCKHFLALKASCTKNDWHGPPYPVYGVRELIGHRGALEMRKSESDCGQDAKWFEPI